MKRKGWFIIPGVQDGDRTLEEQMLGVTPALAGAAGKTVLDLGCAEGLIGREFARAGARSVLAIDSLRAHIDVAQKQCAGLPMKFRILGLEELAAEAMAIPSAPWAFDIVLCLGVAHKLKDPGVGIRFAAWASQGLVLVRLCARGEAKDGILRSKHFTQNTCNVFEIMGGEGFELEQVLPGPREETVHYWRRKG